MWSHSLVEYTALESNIYFAHLMYLVSNNKIKSVNNKYIFDSKIIYSINELVGKQNRKLLLKNVLNNQKIKQKRSGIYRNLYNPGMKDIEYYVSNKIKSQLFKIFKKDKSYKFVIDNFLKKFKYNIKKNKSNYITFLKLLMGLRQILLLIKSKNHLDVSAKLISKDIKMKAKYDYYPFSHTDICSIFYTHATSPMRRFTDINVHSLVFSKSNSNYIYKNLELDVINKSVSIGKFIHNLVNNQLLIEFVQKNSKKTKLVMNASIIDKRNKLIGLVELVNFNTFNETFNIKNDSKVILKLDNYNILELKKISNKEKVFNIFFHMLNKEDNKVRDKCQNFLEKIFSVKKTNKIC
jgi:hypothetical protein